MESIKGTLTEQNLLKAFAGESQARNRYTYFASVAKKEGYEQIAAVFTETAEQEKEHQEWALVLKVPQAVTQSMADMGKPSSFGKVQNEGYLAGYRARGYADGTKFDPSTRLSGGRELAALGG